MRRAAVLGAAIALVSFGVLWAPAGNPDYYFRERRFLSWVSAAGMAASGLLLLRAARGRERSGERWLFWEACGWGLIYLAFDEHFQYHERLGSLAERHVGPARFINHLDDAIMASYGLAAAALFWFHRAELRRFPGSLPLLGGVFAFFALMAAVDALGPDSLASRALEEAFKILGVACLLVWAAEVGLAPSGRPGDPAAGARSMGLPARGRGGPGGAEPQKECGPGS